LMMRQGRVFQQAGVFSKTHLSYGMCFRRAFSVNREARIVSMGHFAYVLWTIPPVYGL
jgi:hypothetical protein